MVEDIQQSLRSTCGIKSCSDTHLSRMSHLAETYNLSGNDVASKYDAFFYASQQGACQVTDALLDGFKVFLEKECGKENASVKHNTGRLWNKRSWEEMPDSVGAQKTKPRLDPMSPSVSPGPGKRLVQPTPGKKVGQESRERIHVEPINVRLEGPQLTIPHRYMRETPDVKVLALDQRIQRFRQALADHLGTDYSDPLPLGVPSQDLVLYVGRVCGESEGPLNDQALVLEGCLEVSEGARVPLDLSQLSSYRLFPGQILAVRGHNPTGQCILVKEVYSHLPASLDRFSFATALASGPPASGRLPLSMVVAAGPYTSPDNVAYEPLETLLEAARKLQAQLIVLLGPFVDADQPLVAGGLLEQTFHEVFHHEVVSRLTHWLAACSPNTTIVMVPSVRDAHHHPTFPCIPFQLDTPGHDKLLMLQNPFSFSVNGAVIAGSSQELLKHLSSAEISRAPGGDRMLALVSHLVGQRSHYPLYPPDLQCCLDLTYDTALGLTETPDILLVPSDLTPFGKILPIDHDKSQQTAVQGDDRAGVLCINPGRVTKGAGLGTFVHLRISEKQSSGQDCAISTRSKVEVVRL